MIPAGLFLIPGGLLLILDVLLLMFPNCCLFLLVLIPGGLLLIHAGLFLATLSPMSLRLSALMLNFFICFASCPWEMYSLGALYR